MILKGFRFGMILQLAIGPICIFIFQTSIAHGFLAGEMGVLGTAIVDSFEIMLAIIGIGIILEKSKKAVIFSKVFGISILLLYSITSIFSVFNISILPKHQASHQAHTRKAVQNDSLWRYLCATS